MTAAGFRTFSKEDENTAKTPVSIDLAADDVDLAGYQHYMRKEILEQPGSVERMLRGRLDDRFGTARLDGLNLGPRELRSFRRVKILGCGSAYYVGQIGAQLIEELRRACRRRGGVGVPLSKSGHRAGDALCRGQPVGRNG